ncbi:MAG: hypothetical protein QF685_04720 [Verrucomicrobiota bacterium]|jgi:hypothetical protein|nr:hypothetical protein [Verrucomicrobiota bacterium]
MDAARHDIDSEDLNKAKRETKKKFNASNKPEQKHHPSLLDSLSQTENLKGKRLRILKKKD